MSDLVWRISDLSIYLGVGVDKDKIHIYQSLASTNDTAKEMAKKGCSHGTVVLADSQTAGRGRFNRQFYSPRSTGLYMSIVLDVDKLTLKESTLLTPYVAVVVARVIHRVTEKKCGIKWVNDLYLEDKKVCGILTEGVMVDGKLSKFVVGIGDANSTVEQFLAGEVETVNGAGSEPKTVGLQNLDDETTYIVYAQAFNRENTGSAVVTAKVTTLEGPGVDIQVQMDNTIQAYVTYTPNENCGGVIALAASASVYYEFAEAFGGEQALLENYYMMDMADVIAAGETKTTMWAMNGECDYEYLVAALVLDENGNVYDIVHAPFTSPSFDENAPEATVTIELGTNDAAGPQLIYTMGEGTVGYYQSVYTQLDYDELVAYGLSIDMTEEEYIQQYTAFYGYVMFENDDFVWPLDPDTEYVAVGCPFNKNGIEGYGKMATLKFKTAPEAEEGAAVREFVTKRNTVKRALVRKEQLDALKK